MYFTKIIISIILKIEIKFFFSLILLILKSFVSFVFFVMNNSD
jgi:hypothetical protein